METLVLKIGGGEVDSKVFLAGLAQVIASLSDVRLILVHGGGKEIGKMLESMELEVKFHEGLRITDDKSIKVVEMVLSASVNKRLTGRLVAEGINAIGISGRDFGLIRAQRLKSKVDLGHVGTPQRVDTAALERLVEAGFLPVISPVSQDSAGVVYNVNADHAAAAIAGRMLADALVFLSNVPGVLDSNGKQIDILDEKSAKGLIEKGVIVGGMIPKVRSALEVLDAGVQKVVITNLVGFETFVREGAAATVVVKSIN